jgi:hypothetical protein
MFQRKFVRRLGPVGACGAAVLLCAAPAPGKDKDSRVACNSAYKEFKTAQADEQSGRLREARELYLSCSKATCAGLVQKCGAKYTALTAALPTVVPIVVDEAGEPRADVQVKVDGEVVTSRLEGRGLAVDPGVHEFSFSTDAGVFATQKIMIIEGDHNRPIQVAMHAMAKRAEKPKSASASKPAAEEKSEAKPAAAEPTPEAASSDKPTPSEAAPAEGTSKGGPHPALLPIVIGGAGLVALAGGGLLTYWGRKDNDALSQCSPNCLPSSLDHIRALYLAADISFGLGVGAVGVATWLYLRSGAIENPNLGVARKFDVHPIRSGAFASYQGAF